jgi:cytosine/adenosine deaminase-related metal-dependent hydrolase
MPLHAAVFLETIGLAAEQQAARLAEASAHLTSARSQPALAGHAMPTVGLSPHAPYTVSWELFTELVRLAARHGAPVAMHLAETAAERELLAANSGPLREFLEAAGVWREAAFPRGATPLDYLRVLATVPRALVIHGNDLQTEEIEFLAARRARMTVVYCPRTHAYFQHPPHPIQKLLSAGVQVAIGTDSRASNPDLSLWEELRFLVHANLLAPQAALHAGTLAGASALGVQHDYGSLEVGKLAAMCQLGPFSSHFPGDPYEALFAAT